ncbi:MAG: hypothetical protein ACI9YE_002462, partial [Psychroserpens sp.]
KHLLFYFEKKTLPFQNYPYDTDLQVTPHSQELLRNFMV